MQNIFIDFLPPWVETGLQPAFYDKESGTVLQQVARMYAKVNQLVKAFDDLDEATVTTVNEYISKFTELKDFVDNYFDNLDVQEEIDHKLDEMVDDGTMQELVNNYLPQKVSYYLLTPSSTADDYDTAFGAIGEKVIEFENGNYTLTSDITINSNTKIILNKAVLTFSGADYIHGFNNYHSDDEYLAYEGNSNITFIGGTIVAGSVSFCHATNITFDSVNFIDCHAQHMLEMMSINGLKVINCTFKGQTSSAGNEYREMIQIDDCSYANFPWFDDEDNPTYDGTPNKNWLIDSCYFGNSNTAGKVFYCGIGSHTAIADSIHENIVIKNCEFDGFSYAGIRTRNVNQVLIDSNIFKVGINDSATPDCIRGEWQNDNVTIRANKFNGNEKQARAIGYNCENVNLNILDNSFYNFKDGDSPSDDTDHILYFGQCPKSVDISDNQFYASTTKIMYIAPADTHDGTIVFEHNSVRDYTISTFLFRLFRGTVYMLNNDFQCAYSAGHLMRLHVNLTKLIFKGNTFTQDISYYMISANNYAGSYRDIEGIYLKQLDGNYSSLSNQAVTLPMADFNTLVCVFGSGTDTYVFKTRPFNQCGKLTSRTYKIATYNASDVAGVASITIDVTPENNYVSFVRGANNLNLRTVWLCNETS